jgi:peptidoglycan/xylan/chitin deacetylase (PgdA/CDA1 family)
MTLVRSLRFRGRQLAIAGSSAMNLDAVERWRERSQLRRARTAVVRVLYLHATPASQAEALRRHLAWLQEHFHIIDFAVFDQILNSTAASDNGTPSLLLTFDDGLASNYAVAAPLLEAAGLRALFFVVPEFSMRSGEEAYRYCRERIRSRHVEAAMTPGQIADLAVRGHTIGNHTFSHANLRKTATAGYEREIIESAAVIESWIGRPVDTFAWPFTWQAITPAAFRLAAERHRYCFAPCPGRTRGGAGAHAPIWRTNLEAHFRPAEVRFQCSGLADLAASARRRQLSRLLAPSAGPRVGVSHGG